MAHAREGAVPTGVDRSQLDAPGELDGIGAFDEALSPPRGRESADNRFASEAEKHIIDRDPEQLTRCKHSIQKNPQRHSEVIRISTNP